MRRWIADGFAEFTQNMEQKAFKEEPKCPAHFSRQTT